MPRSVAYPIRRYVSRDAQLVTPSLRIFCSPSLQSGSHAGTMTENAFSTAASKIMNVPFLDLSEQYEAIRDDVGQAIKRVCESQQFILGPEVEALESEVADYCGARFAIGVSSGTDALLTALMALEVGPGDEVITTTYSFFATAGVVSRLGATPVFVDVEPHTLNLRPEEVERSVTANTRAIIPVHLYGRCARMDPLLELSKSRGIAIVEDAAQAIGAHDERGRSAGTMGSIGCFSFFPTKNLGGFGDGGMVVTDNPDHAHRLRTLRVHGGEPKYHHSIVGGNFRLDELQAAVLREKLALLPKWTEKRRENAANYRELLSGSGMEDRVTPLAGGPGHVYNQFVVRCQERDRLRSLLKERGIGTQVYYPVPLHLQECFRDLGYREGDLPVAETAARDSIALPVYPELAAEQQAYVVEAMGEFYGK